MNFLHPRGVEVNHTYIWNGTQYVKIPIEPYVRITGGVLPKYKGWSKSKESDSGRGITQAKFIAALDDILDVDIVTDISSNWVLADISNDGIWQFVIGEKNIFRDQKTTRDFLNKEQLDGIGIVRDIEELRKVPISTDPSELAAIKEKELMDKIQSVLQDEDQIDIDESVEKVDKANLTKLCQNLWRVNDMVGVDWDKPKFHNTVYKSWVSIINSFLKENPHLSIIIKGSKRGLASFPLLYDGMKVGNASWVMDKSWDCAFKNNIKDIDDIASIVIPSFEKEGGEPMSAPEDWEKGTLRRTNYGDGDDDDDDYGDDDGDDDEDGDDDGDEDEDEDEDDDEDEDF